MRNPLIARLEVAAGLLLLGSAALGAQTRSVSEHVALPATVIPLHYRLTITPDAAALTFAGALEVDIRVLEPVDTVVLNDAELVIDRAQLSGGAQVLSTTYEAGPETATLKLDRRLAPGAYTLQLSYHGTIAKNPAGLFALDYRTAQGGEARALFTQFEAADARRFLPCWDEPGRKATFELSADVPSGEMAVSNTPIVASEAHGALTRVRFARTPKMSSYLLFFALGDFERVHRAVGGVDVGVVVKRGDAARAAFALETAAQILPYYDEYFATRYPLPKLDLIAAPGTSQTFGAMENWGAIMSFERDLLLDPKLSSEADKRRVYIVTAHEMAHQWFGDLVTMAWWDNLWLNEGFASWMENRVTDHFHPEWRVWLADATPRIEQAMSLDERLGTHPIVTPIHDVLQASGSFDRITYAKGAAVIRMLEAYVGADAFRAGVRRYMARYAYGNTVSDDLWREVDRGSARPLTEIAHDFTLQAGVPMIAEQSLVCRGGTMQVELVQDHFAIDPDSTLARRWHVPVTLAVAGGASGRRIVEGPAPQALEVSGCGTVVLNAGQTAYFRSRYSHEGLQAVIGRFAQLDPADELGVLSDTFALATVGDVTMSDFLALVSSFPADADPAVGAVLVGILSDLDHLYDGLPEQAAYRRFAIQALTPLFARIGWDARPGEAANDPLLRADLIKALARLGDPAIVSEARLRFDRLLQNSASLAPEVRNSVLDVMALRADDEIWDRLHAMARASDSQLERMRLYDRLGMAEDPHLAERALTLAVSGEPPATVAGDIIRAVSGQHPTLAVDFVVAHWQALLPNLEPDARPRWLPILAFGADDLGVIRTLDAFAAEHIPASGRQTLVKAESNIRYRAAIRSERLPQVSAWIRARGEERSGDGAVGR